MFDIGFWELLVIAVVLLLVMGPERLPEVARQAAFFVRKARQGMFRIRNEMRSELEGTPFEDLENAKREMSNFKNDIKQFGRDLADSAEQAVGGETEQTRRKDIASRPSSELTASSEGETAQSTQKSVVSSESANSKSANKAKAESRGPDKPKSARSKAKKKTQKKNNNETPTEARED